MTNNATAQDGPETASRQRSPLPYSERQMLPPISSFASKGTAQRLSPIPNKRGLDRVPSGPDDSMRIIRPLSASSQRVDGAYPRDHPNAYQAHSTHLGAMHGSPHTDVPRKSSPSGMDRIMHDTPSRYADSPYSDRHLDQTGREQRPAFYHRYSESESSSSYRQDWNSTPDRMPNDAYARRIEEARWHEERQRRPDQGGPYARHSGYLPPEARQSGRSLNDMDEDLRHLKRRGTFSSSAEVSAHRHNMYASSHQASGPRSYSPPDTFVHDGGSRPGGLTPIDTSRPASAVGVMPVPGTAPAASPSAAGTNTVNANRRVAHLLSEQKRRESINTGFEDLRQAIPTCRDGQDSKATILRRALEYIRELESIVDRSYRIKAESRSIGGFDTRSPPDDQDGLHRFGRSGDDTRRDQRMRARGPNGESDQPSGPHIGGMPGNTYDMHHTGRFVPRTLPAPRYAQAESRLVQATTQGAASHVKPEPEIALGCKRSMEEEARPELPIPVRRRVSEEGQEDSTASSDSSPSSSNGARLVVSRDGETIPASFGMRAMHPSPSIARGDAEKPRQAVRLVHC